MRFMAALKRIIGKRILLVEDEPGARESIKLLLTIDRHEVVEAGGGAEAIELLTRCYGPESACTATT
jgi:CheY-like chemotaxis protein